MDKKILSRFDNDYMDSKLMARIDQGRKYVILPGASHIKVGLSIAFLFKPKPFK